MKKCAIVLATMLAAVQSTTSFAADMDYDEALKLVVSGEVESWSGYTFLSNVDGDATPDNDDYFVSGVGGKLSLPLGDNLSIQMDAAIEYTENAYGGNVPEENYLWSHLLGTHLSWRDPSRGLIGAFGAFGAGRADDSGSADFYAIGGEAQVYFDDLTLYLQAGYLDSEGTGGEHGTDDPFRNAIFVRGVGRWFMTPDSRLQAEFSYANGDQDDDAKDMEVFEWGVRYDMLLAALPVIGDTNVFLGYRGANFDNGFPDDDTGKLTDHTIMVGSVHQFGGPSRKAFDRTGATLDLPNFGRWTAMGEPLD